MRALPIVIAAASVLAPVGLLATVAESAPAPLRSKAFRTPSGNIACLDESSFGGGVRLRCDILSGLRPEPRKPCEGDWVGLSLPARRLGGPICVGDTVYDPRAPVLAYGRTWRRGAFMCTSARAGLTCRNRGAHGFLLARERWRLF